MPPPDFIASDSGRTIVLLTVDDPSIVTTITTPYTLASITATGYEHFSETAVVHTATAVLPAVQYTDSYENGTLSFPGFPASVSYNIFETQTVPLNASWSASCSLDLPS